MAFPHDDPLAPAGVQPTEEGEANLDPLTHEPGAHPVGVGMGAAGAGAVGALLGAVAGPVGVLVGTVIGALTGAVVGKEAAETVNPTEPAALARGAEENAAAEASRESHISPAEIVTSDSGMPYIGAATAAEDTPGAVAPEPMAELAPPPHVATTGSRLRKIILSERSPASAVPPPLEVTTQTSYPEDSVREAAYFRYLERERAGQPGGELEDWVEAEREVLRG